MEYLKASESFRSTALNGSRVNTAPSLGQLLLHSGCLYSAVVVPSHLGSSAKGSLLNRTVNNAKTKGGH